MSDLHHKILLVISNHINSVLARMQLESLNQFVTACNCYEKAIELLNESKFSLVIIESSLEHSHDLFIHVRQIGLPELFIQTTDDRNPEIDKRLLLNKKFSEEEFFQKISYALQRQQASQTKKELHEHILEHYSGDSQLAKKICSSFIEHYHEHLANIQQSFIEEPDDKLAKKIHSFKGVLSAMGETEAAKLIRKMEILVKGRQRELAKPFLKALTAECKSLDVQLQLFSSSKN